MATWLLLEDEPDLYDMILYMYDLIGVRGIAFSVGEEADDWVTEVEHGTYKGELPELALVDIRLPDAVSGVDVAKRLRRSPKLNDISVVLMTAYRLSPQEEADIMRESGADMLLYKPLPRMHELRYMLHSLLAERKSSSTSVG